MEGTRPGGDLEKAPKAESKWTAGRIDLNREERRTVIAKVIEVAIRETFRNHCYRFDGQLYKQTKGGAIGLRLTGIMCRLVMDRWAHNLTEALEMVGITLDMLAKYVDDVNMILPTIGRGIWWTENWDLTWQARAWEEYSGPGARSAQRRTVA